MLYLPCRHHRRLLPRRTIDSLRPLHAQHPLVLMREHLEEAFLCLLPVLQYPSRLRTAGQLNVALNQRADLLNVSGLHQRLQVHARKITAAGAEVTLVVIDIGDAAAHAGSKVASCGAKDHNESLGHVLASVIAHAFNNSRSAGVADCESLAGDAVEEDLARRCAIEDDIANEDRFFRQKA